MTNDYFDFSGSWKGGGFFSLERIGERNRRELECKYNKQKELNEPPSKFSPLEFGEVFFVAVVIWVLKNSEQRYLFIVDQTGNILTRKNQEPRIPKINPQSYSNKVGGREWNTLSTPIGTGLRFSVLPYISKVTVHNQDWRSTILVNSKQGVPQRTHL